VARPHGGISSTALTRPSKLAAKTTGSGDHDVDSPFMLTATCHCGAVRIDVPERPARLTDCNCSICRRYGTLWAYYPAADVRVIAAEGATDAYSHGPRELRFVRCHTCSCITHWEYLVPVPGAKMGVNARNFELHVRDGIPVFPLDGANDRWDD